MIELNLSSDKETSYIPSVLQINADREAQLRAEIEEFSDFSGGKDVRDALKKLIEATRSNEELAYVSYHAGACIGMMRESRCGIAGFLSVYPEAGSDVNREAVRVTGDTLRKHGKVFPEVALAAASVCEDATGFAYCIFHTGIVIGYARSSAAEV